MRENRIKKEKLKILSVSALDGDTFGITLDSGHIIMLELASRIREPTFAALIASGDFSKPSTDGDRIYWPDGSYITLEEILRMIQSPGDAMQTNFSKRKDIGR